MKFKNIYSEINRRSKLALHSFWTPGIHHPMYGALSDLLDRETVIAEPVFQSTFPWEDTNDDNWRNLFSPRFLSRIISNNFTPRKNQTESWNALENNKSIVVTSGTGSGKTECFMYPVLNDLYNNGHPNNHGIQAIFLYPLNALMEDQRERLKDDCLQLGLKYVVYNGDLKETRHDEIRQINRAVEVGNRDDLRKDPPAIMFSNPSMLEYMLVRNADKPIIEQSQDLRWIIIDEAHTYSGSAAVELKYQIRRILNAFGKTANEVKFACTSATLGADMQTVKHNFADLLGKDENDIEIIGGNRVVPEIDDDTINQAARNLDIQKEKIETFRNYVNSVDGVDLNFVCSRLGIGQNKSRALEILDELCERNILSLRGHFFIRSVNGLRACVNPECDHHNDSPFGYITSKDITECPYCHMPMLELVQCKNCGEWMVYGAENNNGNSDIKSIPYKKWKGDSDDMENQNDDINCLNTSVIPQNYQNFLLGRYNPENPYRNNPAHFQVEQLNFVKDQNILKLDDADNNDCYCRVRRINSDRVLCPSCSQNSNVINRFTLNVDFLNKNIISPVLLRETAPQNQDWGKYIAFTDSRQGTAISAKIFNAEVERQLVQSVIIKYLTDQRNRGNFDVLLDDTIKNLIFSQQMYDHRNPDNNDRRNAYQCALMRILFGRRRSRDKSLENLGLVKLVYPELNQIDLPGILVVYNQQHPENIIPVTEWRKFLKICIDFFIRYNNYLEPLKNDEDLFIRNNQDLHTRRLNPNDWPSLNDGIQNRFVLLLCAGLQIYDLNDQNNRDLVAGLLNEAKNTILGFGLMQSYYINSPTYYLKYTDNTNVRIALTDNAKVCPVTHNLVDTDFCGYSPFMLPAQLSEDYLERYRCIETVVIPHFENLNINPDDWVVNNPDVLHFKELGIWSDIYENIFLKPNSIYIAAEHSAQLSRSQLEKYADDFKEGRLNVLNCSTTMEMGVDIGSIDAVLMATVPPAPSNYLQRAGRAGRAGQARSVALTICNSSPVAMKVFKNPMWPFSQGAIRKKRVESETIIQRHINAYYFRKFLITPNNQREIRVNGIIKLEDFFQSEDPDIRSYVDLFIDFLGEMQNNGDTVFNEVFPGHPNTIDITIRKISTIKDEYFRILGLYRDALRAAGGNPIQLQAVGINMSKFTRQNFLMYLAENQFIPNANMPTGIFEFMAMYKGRYDKIKQLTEENERLAGQLERTHDPNQRPLLQNQININLKSIDDKFRQSILTREMRVALNEFAPEQTIVRNEKNYVSEYLNEYNSLGQAGQWRYISKCDRCGKIKYNNTMNLGQHCNCGGFYRSIIMSERLHSSFATAIEPTSFSTDYSQNFNTFEETNKNYYEINTILEGVDWNSADDIGLCKVLGNNEGRIIYYNKGRGNGFTICTQCYKAVVSGNDNQIPQGFMTHYDRYGNPCNPRPTQVKQHVVLSGSVTTAYVALKLYSDLARQNFESDLDVVTSIGVIVRRALIEYLGIDDNEIDFDINMDGVPVLFFYDTNKGGCGYSTELRDSVVFGDVMKLAYEKLRSAECDCEHGTGACCNCLIERGTYRYEKNLSKAKALEWLARQNEMQAEVPQNILAAYPDAKYEFKDAKLCLKLASKMPEVTGVDLYVSDRGMYKIEDWASLDGQMGRIINEFITNQKRVEIYFEYHNDEHSDLDEKIQYLNFQQRFANCNVRVIQDTGECKPLFVVHNNVVGDFVYFTLNPTALSISDLWAEDVNIFVTRQSLPVYLPEQLPVMNDIINQARGKVIKDGRLQESRRIRMDKFYRDLIVPVTNLDRIDQNNISAILTSSNVNMEFSDTYLSSGLKVLMLYEIISELKNMFDLNIHEIKINLLDDDNNKNHQADNRIYNDRYRYINFNFKDFEERNEFIRDKFEWYFDGILLNLEERGHLDHDRWLCVRNLDNNSIFEIRFDHGIGATWKAYGRNYESLNTYLMCRDWYISNEGDELFYVVYKNEG